VADHRFSTQRGLPNMIDGQYRIDGVPWLLQHGIEVCPQEAGLCPLIELGRILDIYGVLISEERVSMELLRCLEQDVKAWKGNWGGGGESCTSFPFSPFDVVPF
jgi:hypothetical protein